MERRNDGSSPTTTVNNTEESSPCHHHLSTPGDVITLGLSGRIQHVTCSGDSSVGPIRCCSVIQDPGEDQGVGRRPGDDVTHAARMSSSSVGSKVNCCGGGATEGIDLGVNLSTAAQQWDVTFDLPEVCPDDEAFALPPIAPHSGNTFQSRPGQLIRDRAGPEPELQSRRPEIIEYFSSRKQRSVSQSVPGWKLFGKVPPKQSLSKQAQIIQQEFEARQLAPCSSPTHHAVGQQSRRKVEFEPLSTTALILEDRPPNLPAKSEEETQRHQQQYEEMVAAARRRELKEVQRRQQQREERFRQEEEISSSTLVWKHNILPHWDAMRSSCRTRDLWWGGLPPGVRGRVWSVAVGNELNITAELYDIFISRAKERRSLCERRSLGDNGAPPAESGLDLVTWDVSRTFPLLRVFQKGGPYHELLQSILGAYSCYRPDVGYVRGMSSVAAMLVLNMDPVDAFISFSNLVNRPCQQGFYRVQHQLMCRYFGAFQVFLEELLPCLFLHFQAVGVTPDLYLLDWILSLYTNHLPLEVACRVWDVFFRDGEEFLFRTGLGILSLHQDVLLRLDLVGVAQFLSRPPDEELLSDRLFSCISATPMLNGNRKWSQVLSSCSQSESSS